MLSRLTSSHLAVTAISFLRTALCSLASSGTPPEPAFTLLRLLPALPVFSERTPAPGGSVDIAVVQRQAWDNKQSKGFNVSDVPLEFGLLTAEIGEAFTAWRKQLPDFGEELADVMIYLAGLAQMTGIDLSGEVERKLAKNAARRYRPDNSGVLNRVD